MIPSRLVSIPVWFDWESPTRPHLAPSSVVSIPVWFDWEAGGLGYIRHLRQCFNSSMVRLGDQAIINLIELPVFQFQYGSIGSIATGETSTRIL